MSVMREPIEQSCGQTFIAKNLHPIGKLKIGSNNHGHPFVEFRTPINKMSGWMTLTNNASKLLFLTIHSPAKFSKLSVKPIRITNLT